MSEHTETPKLSGQFSKALVYAELKHHNQVRKGGDIPYVGHLLSVASLVINDGGTEEQAIAALLHDAVEDQGGPATLEEIRANFGEDVARIVEQCSDTDEVPKPPWLERKRRYIDHLGESATTRCWCRWPTSWTTRGRCCATTTRTVRRCGTASTGRTRTTTSGTTRACSRRIASAGWTAGWSTNSAGWSASSSDSSKAATGQS